MAESEGALSKLLDIIFSSEHRLSKRAALMVVLCAGVLLLDNYVGFSDFYAFEHKVEQVQKIEGMLQRTDLDSSVRKDLRVLEGKIISRKSWIAHLPSLITLVNKPTITSVKEYQKPTKVIVVTRDPLIHTFTSAWPIVIFMLIVLVAMFSQQINASAIGGLLIFELVLASLGYGLSALYSLIPVLFNEPTWNYVLNTVLSSILTFIMLAAVAGYSTKK